MIDLRTIGKWGACAASVRLNRGYWQVSFLNWTIVSGRLSSGVVAQGQQKTVLNELDNTKGRYQ
jgi:hypothetical protein